MAPLHVRILANYLDRRTGSHVYHLELARRLLRRGHRVSVLCFGPGADALPGADVRVVATQPFDQQRLSWRFAAYCQYRHITRGTARLVDLPAPDVVVGGEHLFLKAHYRRFPRTPWIYLPHSLVIDNEMRSYHCPPAMEWVAIRVYRRLQKWAMRNADRTLRFTKLACDKLSEHYRGKVRARYAVNPMGVEMPQDVGQRDRGAEVRLLWVGQLILRKRIHVALTALAGLKQYAWQFDIVGGGGESRHALEQQAASLGLADRVRFHGHQQDPTPWYRQADLLLFPSDFENCPVTMLEAMSFAIPCLAMRADGKRFQNAHAEILTDGVSGFLASSDEDFARQLEHLLQQPARIRTAGLQAREAVAARHTWDRHLEGYEHLFEKLTARPASDGSAALVDGFSIRHFCFGR